MHKMIDYICDELDDLERKAANGKLSMQEVQYADTLAHLKKNLLTADAMMDSDDEYSNRYSRDDGTYIMHDGSYARDRYGRYMSRDRDRGRGRGYSRKDEDIIAEVKEIMDKAPNNQTRKEFEKLIMKLEQM